MKKYIKFLTIPLIVLSFILYTTAFAFAAEINSNPANVGDTVTYEIRVNPCPNTIQALDVVIYYDSNSLEYVPYSLELTNISGFMTNTDLDGEIRFNAMDFVGFDFSEDKILSKVEFTVKDTSAQDISLNYQIKTFIDSTTTDLGSTYTYDVTSVNGGVDRNIETDSELFDDTDTMNDTVSTDSDELLDNSDTDTNFDDSDTDSNTDFDTDTAADSDTEIIDHFDEFLTELNSEVSSEPESIISSQPENQNKQSNAKHYIIAFAAAIAVISVIAIIFKFIAKRSMNSD